MFYSKTTNGFYTTERHGSNMPSDVVEITQQLHESLKLVQSQGAKIKADETGNPIAVWPAPPTLSELKLAKKAEITLAFNATMSQVVGDTPAHEISSWGKQEMEARAFSNAATALNPTPLIDNLATSRGIPKALLASKIVAKADQFASYSGQLIGKRQGLEGSVEAATSKTALAAITW